jgi:photosystem II stability/assembly factor-like uncharacterized protein
MTMQLYAATRKGLFIIEPGRWTLSKPHFLGDPVTAVLAHDGALYAALNLGHFGVKLRRSDDGGESWSEIAAPAYPAKPDGLDDKTPWKLAQIWTLEGAGDTLWAGTIPGGLFRSRDRGESWSLVRTLWDRKERSEWFGGGYDHPGIHSICNDPRDARKLTIAISCGGVWQSADGGENWRLAASGMHAEYFPPERKDEQNIQDVHRMVQAPSRPEVLYAQHHNGVFRSVDGAASWQEITAIVPSKFGFAVAVHPHEPDTAWFVPADKDERRVPLEAQVVVARTRDGGKSFQLLRDGLPQEHAYDLVYRHGLAVDSSGERLAIGSTTGGLWVSEDQGDRWRSISAHLPPIYALRFA